MGDRVQNIIDARQRLAQLTCIDSLRSSSLYLSSPVGYSAQPNFINCVLAAQVIDDVENFFKYSQEIEISLGRVRDLANQNAARTIDIDILLFGNACIDVPQLEIPHPRLAERLFVISPLLELNPELTISGQGALAVLLEKGKQEGVFNSQIIHKLA